jgi:hypothetical protein
MYHVMSRGDRREKIFLDDVEFPVPLNPVRAGMVPGQARLLSYPWSSFGDHHSSELRRASAKAKAERIIAEELQRQGWQEADLLVRPKNDAVKLEIAARLRRETTLSTKAIAARMHLGSSKAANRSSHSSMRGGAVASAGQGQLAI